LLKKGCEKIRVPAISLRSAVLTRRHNGRAPCHYCRECDRGCDTSSRFCTLDAIIPGLLTRQNFTLRTGAAVRRVVMDSGRNVARGVEFIDTQTRKSYEVYAKTVVLGAGAMESTRILFNSRTREYPSGLANSSGVLGHYLMDSVKSGSVQGWLPRLKGGPVLNDDGAGGGHVYIPRFQN